MEFYVFVIAIGLLLVTLHACSHVVARLPLSPAILYFVCGVGLGLWGFDWMRIDPARHAALIERLCELAILVSLFSTGSNLGTTLHGKHWAAPIRLASIAMVITIAALAGLLYSWLDMSLGAAIIIAAALAPTDPVLAGDVQVSDPSDRDRLRAGLTGEAGLNDGTAYPFVLLGLGLLSLHDLGPGMWRWWAIDLVWAIAGGIAIGAVLGIAVGRWVLYRLRSDVEEESPDAFLGLGLVAIAYGIAVSLSASGFLAVFAAAVALQRTVMRPKAAAGNARGTATATLPVAERSAAIASLQQFNSDLESFCEFGLVIVIGVLCTVVPMRWEALLVAALLFLVVRPVAVYVAVGRATLERNERALAAWFGIRGIGSLYYVMFALRQGWNDTDAERALGIVLGVVAASIFLHGISVTPLMSAYERHHARRGERRRKPSPRPQRES
jgi:NhaP-type Na+/H+ or K+/H+ antiporter